METEIPFKCLYGRRKKKRVWLEIRPQSILNPTLIGTFLAFDFRTEDPLLETYTQPSAKQKEPERRL